MEPRSVPILLPLLLGAAGEDGAPPAGAPGGTVTTRSVTQPFVGLVAALPFVAEGERYEVRTDLSPEVASETLAVLEAAWPAFVDRFGREAVPRSGRRLPIHVYRSRDLYRAHQSSGMEPWSVSAAGFYDRVHGVGHLEWSPLPYSQRRLLLHEAAHQFHYLSLGRGRRDIFPRWYVEGVANDLDRHRFAGGAVALGVEEVPFTLGHEDLAHANVVGRAFDLARLLDGGAMSWVETDRERKAVGHVLVRFLRSHEDVRVRRWFARFEAAVSRGYPPPRWPEHLPSVTRTAEEFERFVTRLRPARTTPQCEWQRRGTEVRACVLTGGSSSWPCVAAPGPGEATSLRFEVGHALHPSDGIGFVVGFVDAANFSVVVFKDRLRRLLVTTRRDGRWIEERTVEVEAPERTRGAILELDRGSDGRFRVGLDGRARFEGDLPADLRAGGSGFWGEAADAPGRNPGSRLFRFSDVRCVEEIRAR